METIKPGTVFLHDDQANDRKGVVLREIPAQPGVTVSIYIGTFKKILTSFEIVWFKQHEDFKPSNAESLDKIHDHGLEPMIKEAQQHSLQNFQELYGEHGWQDVLYDVEQQAKLREEERANAREQASIEADKKKKDFNDKYIPLVPAWAKSYFLGSYVIDKCDGQSDYYGHSYGNEIILGFSKHTRNLFPEMRKASLNHSDTKFLNDLSKEGEHKENYTGGGGYYLKDGWQHSTGWSITKVPFYDGKISLPCTATWAVPDKKPAMVTTSETLTAGIEEHTHTKKKIQMFIVILSEKVDKETFNSLRENCKLRGGWYSRAWAQTPGGFAFEDPIAAENFKKDLKL